MKDRQTDGKEKDRQEFSKANLELVELEQVTHVEVL